MEFRDAEFMNAREKAAVLKDWERFLRGLIEDNPQNHFTKRLYEHLHLHCAFIAHYDRSGFYGTYFENPESTLKFLSQFSEETGYRSVEYGDSYRWLSGDYADINKAMCEAFEKVKPQLIPTLEEMVRSNYVSTATRLLAKHGMTVQQVRCSSSQP